MAAEEHGSLRSRASLAVGVNKTRSRVEPARKKLKVFVFVAYLKKRDFQLAPPYSVEMMVVGQDG